MKLSSKPLLALACLLPALGTTVFQEGERQEGPLRTGEGGLVTGTGADPLDDDGDGAPPPLPEGGIGNRETGELDIYGRRTKQRANTLQARLMGGWRLVEMKLDGYDERGRLAQGFLHVGPAFLSMELHALWSDNAPVDSIPAEDIHTSFTAEYRVDGSGTLECTTVIGSFVDDETGELTWERNGYERRYVIRETGKQLILIFGERGDVANRLVFEPFLPTLRGATDIFGRRIDSVGTGATDIFGRSVPSEGGERDIFGRIKKVAPPEDEEGEDESPATGGAAPRTGRGGRR